MTPREQAIMFAESGAGFQGALARLMFCWDPTVIEMWLGRELELGTTAYDIAKAMAEDMTAASYGAMQGMPPGVDKLAFLNGDLGILGQMRDRLERRLSAPTQTKGGIILPGGSG